MSIYKKLNEFKKKVGAVKKDGKNPFHKSKYATIESVLDTIEEPLNDVGLGFYQSVEDKVLKTVIFDCESGENIESKIPLILAKDDMQQLGSAITYARRYGLVTMFGLEQEDDDGNKASGYSQKTNNLNKEQIKQLEQKPQQKPIVKINKEQIKRLEDLLISDEHKQSFLAKCKISNLEDMPLSWFDKAINSLK